MSNLMNDEEYKAFFEGMLNTWAYVSRDDDAMNKLREESLESHLSTKNLKRIPIPGYGNCFYRAVEILTNFGHVNKTFDGSLLRNAIADLVSDPSVWGEISADVNNKTQEEFIADVKKNGRWADVSLIHYLVPKIIRKTLRVHYFDYSKKTWNTYIFGRKWADPIDLIWDQTLENGVVRGTHYDAAARPDLARWLISKLEKIENESSRDCTTLLRKDITPQRTNTTANMESNIFDEIDAPTKNSLPQQLPYPDPAILSRPPSAFKPISPTPTPFAPWASAPFVPQAPAPTPAPTYVAQTAKITKQDLIRRELERSDRQEERQGDIMMMLAKTQQTLVENQQKSDERWANVFGTFAMLASGGAITSAPAQMSTPALTGPSITPMMLPASAPDRFARVKDIKTIRMRVRVERLIEAGQLDEAEAMMKRALSYEEEDSKYDNTEF